MPAPSGSTAAVPAAGGAVISGSPSGCPFGSRSFARTSTVTAAPRDVLTASSTATGATSSTVTVTVPIAIFVLGIWWIALRANADRVVNTVVPIGAILVLLDPVIPIPVTLTAVIMVIVVVVLVLRPPVART